MGEKVFGLRKEKRTEVRKTYFAAFESSKWGQDSGSPSMEFKFIKASSPEDALEKMWKTEVENRPRYQDYKLEIHKNAEDYHRKREPLAKQSKYDEDPHPCCKSNCPYC